MSERRDLREEARFDRLRVGEARDRSLGVHEQFDRLESGRERRLDQILPFTTEKAQTLALVA
jgi:hypothetical protein